MGGHLVLSRKVILMVGIFTNEAQCNQALHHHINKGDPIDCINYLAFMNARGWKVTADQDALGCIRLYETAFDEMFGHCLSNGVYNQWGKSFDCTTLNLAHEKASSFLRKTL